MCRICKIYKEFYMAGVQGFGFEEAQLIDEFLLTKPYIDLHDIVKAFAFTGQQETLGSLESLLKKRSLFAKIKSWFCSIGRVLRK